MSLGMSRRDLAHRLYRDHHRVLDPSWFDRLSRLTRPGWARTVAARRAAAAALAGAALVLVIRGDPDTEQSPTVVATHDLRPGHILTTDDLRIADRGSRTLPEGALTNLDDTIGHTLAGPTRAGEIITDIRVLGPRLAAAAAGSDDARVVPVRLADAGVSQLLREGDLVDVLTVAPDTSITGTSAPGATVLASGATVVLVSPEGNARDRHERVVMLALAPHEANSVAAASLTSAITVTLH